MEPWLQGLATAIAGDLASGRIHDKASLQKAKHHHARRLGAPRFPRDPEVLAMLDGEQQAQWARLLRKKPMRSQSGVAIVAVMSSPAACPHGKCVYCPGGPDAGVPQSYTGFEPSTMRAMRWEYDAYRIVRGRLAQLVRNGHPVDKIEVVVQGGTFPARDAVYQEHFIASIYQACNDGPAGDASHPDQFHRTGAAKHSAPGASLTGPDGDAARRGEFSTSLRDQALFAPLDQDLALPWSLDDWQAMPVGKRHRLLEQVQRANEVAACRIVGLTVETKPDWCLEPHIDAMLRQGATRIELGIQTLDEVVTKLTNRGHTVEDARRAMQVAREAGYKVCVHMMPGLPRPLLAGNSEAQAHFVVDPLADIEDMRRLFADPAFRPDMLKIYPTLVVQEGETALKRWWREGRFSPMDTEQAVDVVAESLRHVPEYCRIQRIDRDIPTTHVLAGVMNSNLRQLAEAEAERRGIRLRDIRAREIGTRLRQGVRVEAGDVRLVTRPYEASGGTEAFISLEDKATDTLTGFVRVRHLAHPHREELAGPCAIVRELKVYGAAQRLGEHDPAAWQHRGQGTRLLQAAEEQAAAWGADRLAVLAGAGVKQYYRRRGYMDRGPYVAKDLP